MPLPWSGESHAALKEVGEILVDHAIVPVVAVVFAMAKVDALLVIGKPCVKGVIAIDSQRESAANNILVVCRWIGHGITAVADRYIHKSLAVWCHHAGASNEWIEDGAAIGEHMPVGDVRLLGRNRIDPIGKIATGAVASWVARIPTVCQSCRHVISDEDAVGGVCGGGCRIDAVARANIRADAVVAHGDVRVETIGEFIGGFRKGAIVQRYIGHSLRCRQCGAYGVGYAGGADVVRLRHLGDCHRDCIGRCGVWPSRGAVLCKMKRIGYAVDHLKEIAADATSASPP